MLPMLLIGYSLFAALLLPPSRQLPMLRDTPEYTVTDIGALPTYEVSFAWGLNRRGDVAGYCFTSATRMPHAFLWRNGQMTDLGALDGRFSLGNRVNNKDQVTGYSWTGRSTPDRTGPQYHAFLWNKGAMRDLGALPGFPNSFSAGVNDRGGVIGTSEMFRGPSSPCRAFLWRNGRMRDLGTLPGKQDSSAFSINDRGQIVGEAGREDKLHSAVLWSNGRIINLGSLAGSASSQAISLNDFGQVLCNVPPLYPPGVSRPVPPTLPARAFIFDHGHVRVLKPPQGFVSVEATRINNAGTAVGDVTDTVDPVNAQHQVAAIFKDGLSVDLNTKIAADSGWSLERALAINDQGLILGAGMHHGHYHAFLLTPKTVLPSTPAQSHF